MKVEWLFVLVFNKTLLIVKCAVSGIEVSCSVALMLLVWNAEWFVVNTNVAAAHKHLNWELIKPAITMENWQVKPKLKLTVAERCNNYYYETRTHSTW